MLALLQTALQQLAVPSTLTLEKYRSRFTHLFNGETEHLAKNSGSSHLTKFI